MGNLDWKKLYFGHVYKDEVLAAVKDPEWQRIRLSMKGVSLVQKYATLKNYLRNNKEEDLRAVQVRITNYVTALSRGGLIKPSDYLGEGA